MNVYIKLCYIDDDSGSFERSQVGGSGSACATVVNETDSDIRRNGWKLSLVTISIQAALHLKIPAHSQKDVVIELRGRHTEDLTKVTDTVTMKLSRLDVERTSSLSFGLFAKGLQNYVPTGLPGADGTGKFNVLLFGLAGSTKSSFVNSALTLMGNPGQIKRDSLTACLLTIAYIDLTVVRQSMRRYKLH